MKGLYDRGLSRQDIRELFRVIDWMMVLPEGLGQLFWSELQQYEQEKRMPYVTRVERWVIERGREEGRAGGLPEGLAVGLELGARGKRLLSRIRRITDTATLASTPGPQDGQHPGRVSPGIAVSARHQRHSS